MTQECTLKELFIAKKLDEFQPTWREGDDVVFDTKKKIQEYIQTHYEELFDITGSACITFLSLEKTIRRLRKKLEIQSKREKSACIAWMPHDTIQQVEDNSLNDFIPPIREGKVEPEIELIDDAAYANNELSVSPVHVPVLEPVVLREPESKVRTIELVQMSCNNPLCDQFAYVTQEDKWYFLVTSPMRYGKFIRPYCSTKCKEDHKAFLRNERIKSMPA